MVEMKILPNTQRLGKLTFDSNQVRKSSTNPNVLIAKASDGKDYGVVRKDDGSYDFAGSSRNSSFGDRMATASANPNIGTRLLETAGLLASEPQRMMTRKLTNNRYNNPEEVVADSKLPDGMLKNTLGFAAGMVIDPFNLVGAGAGIGVKASKYLSNLGKVANKITPLNYIDNPIPKFSMPKNLESFSVKELRKMMNHRNITIPQITEIYNFKNQKVQNKLTRRFAENDLYIENMRRNSLNELPSNNLRRQRETSLENIIDNKNQRDEDLLESFRRDIIEMKERRTPSQVQLPNLPDITNTYSRSGFTREGVLNRVDNETKKLIENLPDKDFEKIVLKPNGKIDFIASDLNVGRTTSGIEQISKADYVKTFNDNLPRLNEIIARKNTSGVPYTVTGIDESGRINFNSSKGPSYFSTGLVPGKFKGEVQDIADANYYRNLPGLNMGNTMSGVFGDRIARRGTKTYESINDYLKSLDLGRVKPGFNSQTEYSRGAWENFVKSGKAVGYYNNTGTVYGSMKTVLPPAAIAAGAAASTMSNKDKNNKFKYGGKLLPLLK
jgi:hypothetical protein